MSTNFIKVSDEKLTFYKSKYSGFRVIFERGYSKTVESRIRIGTFFLKKRKES